MLAIRTSSGSAAAATQTAWGRSVRSIRRATIACSSPVPRVAQQLLAEMVVNGRIGAAPGRARQRERAHPVALATDQQLGAGATSVVSPRPAQKTKHDGKASRSTPNTAAGS